MNSPSFILLDIGGTDVKTAIAQTGRADLENLRRTKIPSFLELEEEIKEIDPTRLLSLVKNEISHQLLLNPNVVGILVSSQMACWILIGKNGKEITNLVSWQDKRSTLLDALPQLSNLTKVNGGETGEGLPVLGLLHVTMKKIAPLEEIKFETLSSWVIRKLSGGNSISMCHVTDAAATGFFDIRGSTWRADLIAEDLVKINYPQISKDVVCAGHLLDTSIPIFVGVGDQQASLLGAGIDVSTLVVNIGTGGQVACLGQRADEYAKERPFFNSQSITTKTHLPAGRLISKIRDVLICNYGFHTTYEELATWSLDNDEFLGVESLKVENCQEVIFELVARGYEFSKVISVLLGSVALVYAKEIGKLQKESHQIIVFAGGVGQRFTNLQKMISSETKLDYKISDTEETTLSGLVKLMNEF